MTARRMLERAEADLVGRLRWRVMGLLGICPASLRGRLLSRRRAMALACQLILDAGRGGAGPAGDNPNFDMARFRRLAGGNAK